MDTCSSSTCTPEIDSITSAASTINHIVTVKFITQDGSVFTQHYLDTITVGQIKSLLVDVFSLPASSLIISHNEQDLCNTRTLKEFCQPPYNTIEFKLSSGTVKHAISAELAYKDITIADVITVRVQTECEGYKNVVVAIENKTIQKPFIGGYVNKTTLIEYHHAYTQTGPSPPKVPPENKNHRDTQTCFWRHRKTETNYSHATQMTHSSTTWIPNINDKILVAGPYETAEEREKRIDVLDKIRKIQRWYRSWKLLKLVKFYSQEFRKRLVREQEDIARYNKSNERARRRELITKVFPRTKAEFASVYSMIERWKRSEIERISKNYCGPSKIAEFYTLLDREVEMLRTLETHRTKLRSDMKLKKDMQFFEAISNPIKWNSNYKNIPIEMDTVETQKGREYYQSFKEFCYSGPNSEKRLQALLNVKISLQDHICPLATELVNLINRACELTARGMRDKHLDMLYKRIRSMMIRHYQQPECNEGVTGHKLKTKEQHMENNLFYCQRCQKLRTSESFTLDSRVRILNICSTCMWFDKSAEPWINLSPYRFMLRTIRREERMKRATSSYAFILQDRDIFYLVNNIWHGTSAVSENHNVYQLHLCRWLRFEDWSPWNCILLTRDEAKSHLQVRELETVYDQQFISKVNSLHKLARRHFEGIIGLDEDGLPEEIPPKPMC